MPRSRGFEGLAPLRQRGMLVAALEAGPKGTPPDQTRLLEFDTASGLFTRRDWIYPFDAPGHSLTEFVADDKSFLAIERDDLQGPAARFKKVFRVELGAPGQVVRKTLVADLLAIDNPQRLGGFPTTFTFPFITPEAVWPLDRHTILVVDDNNYPETGARAPNVRDDTEFIKLRIRRPRGRGVVGRSWTRLAVVGRVLWTGSYVASGSSRTNRLASIRFQST